MKKVLIITFIISTIFSYAQAPGIEWQSTYGGSGGEVSYSHVQTNDGGFVIAGLTSSDSNGEGDFYIFKVDAAGNIIWQHNYGGSKNDTAYNIKQTSDGGFIVVGSTYSDDGDVIGYHGPLVNSDVWVLKLTAIGEIEWQKTLGGSSFDDGRAVMQTIDGGYIVAATSESEDGDLSDNDNNGYQDFWVIKLSSSGILEWDELYGGSGNEMALALEHANDDNYFIAGVTGSNDGDVSGFHSSSGNHPDGWVIKINSLGVLQWQKCYGGNSYERISCIKKTNDGGFIFGSEAGAMDGDVNVTIQGETDAWLVKIDATGNIQWQKSYGGTAVDHVNDVIQTADSGFLLAIQTYSTDGDAISSNGSNEGLIIKTNSQGEIVWKRTLGGSQEDYITCISSLSDGTFYLTGGTGSTDGDIDSENLPDGYDVWSIILESESLSTQKEEIEYYSIYPNPVSNMLNIQSNSTIDKLVITDILGKRIKEKFKTKTINVEDLQYGIYILQVHEGNKVSTSKFIKN